MTDSEPDVEPWESALRAVQADYEDVDSWDLEGLYILAAEKLIDQAEDRSERNKQLILLTADLIHELSGESADFRLVGVLVKRYGKAAIVGWARSIGVTEGWDQHQWFRYANGVCRRLLKGESE